MVSGTVTWFHRRRGVGGITGDGVDGEVAVQSSEIDGGDLQSLRPHNRVSLLTVIDGPLWGARAVRVWTP